MPGNLKKLVRARMRLTGENYQAAILAVRQAAQIRNGPSPRAFDAHSAAELSIQLVPPRAR